MIAMHSFTPVFRGIAPRQVGLLFNRYPEFAHLLAELLREEGICRWASTNLMQ